MSAVVNFDNNLNANNIKNYILNTKSFINPFMETLLQNRLIQSKSIKREEENLSSK